MHRIIIAAGACNAFLATALGAIAAHALDGRISQHHLAVFDTGADYHMYHALGLILIGLIYKKQHDSLVKAAAWLMGTGILLFSGSLYILAVSNMAWLGMVTPFGGLCFLSAWLALVMSQLKTCSK